MSASPSEAVSYVLISPCRDEEEFAQRTIDSVAGQTLLPSQWVIVDDGSTDGTPNILERAAQTYRWIKVVRCPDAGRRQVGGGVVRAFNVGLAELGVGDYEYIGKLDLDLEIPATYFEHLIGRMRADERLGSFSGKPYHYVGDRFRLVPEHIGDDVSVGGTKFYRKMCFSQIGGLVEAVMWDGIDCHEARRRGWRVGSSDAQELRFVHLRPMGSSEGGIWEGRVRHGRGLYFLGASVPYAFASAAYRLRSRPRIIGSVGILAGYLSGLVHREPRYGDIEYRTFVRRYHRLCLTRGKRRAVEIVDQETAHLWSGSASGPVR